MKYKVGDKVRIKSLEWYNESKNGDDYVSHPNFEYVMLDYMNNYCGKIATIIKVIDSNEGTYLLDIDVENPWKWQNWMFEENIINETNNMKTKEVKIEAPEGYEVDKDKSTFEKIVFKPIKNKYPKWE